MKSAYERALERSGGALNELSPEKKKEIAEFREALANEIRSIRDRYEAKKQAVRDRR